MNSLRASEVDWSETIHPRLSPSEWPDGTLRHMTFGVILALSELRSRVDVPFFPSPVFGAHVRHERTGSRHSTRGGERLSDATDFFVPWEGAARVLHAAYSLPSIGGLGIYDSLMLRGTPGDFAMLHIDTRPERVLWAGHGREPIIYCMAASEPALYHQRVSDMLRRA